MEREEEEVKVSFDLTGCIACMFLVTILGIVYLLVRNTFDIIKLEQRVKVLEEKK